MHPDHLHDVAKRDHHDALAGADRTRRARRARRTARRDRAASGRPRRTVGRPRGAAGRGRGFARLWVSAGSSNLADGVLFAGLPVLALQVTDSPALIAGVALALMLPMTALALPAGVIADRFDRRRVLVLGNLVRVGGLGAVVVAVLAGELHLAAIYAAAAVAGGSEILVDTAAQTAVPGLVEERDLAGANAKLGGTQIVMNDAVGAPIGSFLAGMGAGLAFGVPVVLFAFAAVVLRRLPLVTRAAADRTPTTSAELRTDLQEGIAYVAGHPVLRRLALVNTASNLGNTAFGAVFVLFVVGPVDLPAATYGWFLAALAVGGLAGSAVASRLLARFGHAVTIKLVSLCVVGIYALVTLTSSAWVLALAAGGLGAGSMIWNIGSRVLRQTLVPDALLGRATATMALAALVATPLGAVVGGAVAEFAGVRAVGLVAVATSLLAFVLLHPVTTTAVEAARTEAEHVAQRGARGGPPADGEGDGAAAADAAPEAGGAVAADGAGDVDTARMSGCLQTGPR